MFKFKELQEVVLTVDVERLGKAGTVVTVIDIDEGCDDDLPYLVTNSDRFEWWVREDYIEEIKPQSDVNIEMNEFNDMVNNLNTQFQEIVDWIKAKQ